MDEKVGILSQISKPIAARRANKWCFANLQVCVSQQVYEIGEAYRDRFQHRKINHKIKYPTQLLKYFYFLYLTGSRLMEPVLTPIPQIRLINRIGECYIEITKVNEKHTAMDGTKRETIDIAMPIFDKYEQHMWNYITDGGLITNSEDIFKFDEWKSIKKNNLSGLVKSNFRCDLRDENSKLHRDCGITPHILRHMRAFSVIVNYGVPVPLAIKWFGWTDERMLYYYAHIRKEFAIGNQIEMMRKNNLFTNLHIDIAKVIPY